MEEKSKTPLAVRRLHEEDYEEERRVSDKAGRSPLLLRAVAGWMCKNGWAKRVWNFIGRAISTWALARI